MPSAGDSSLSLSGLFEKREPPHSSQPLPPKPQVQEGEIVSESVTTHAEDSKPDMPLSAEEFEAAHKAPSDELLRQWSTKIVNEAKEVTSAPLPSTIKALEPSPVAVPIASTTANQPVSTTAKYSKLKDDNDEPAAIKAALKRMPAKSPVSGASAPKETSPAAFVAVNIPWTGTVPDPMAEDVLQGSSQASSSAAPFFEVNIEGAYAWATLQRQAPTLNVLIESLNKVINQIEVSGREVTHVLLHDASSINTSSIGSRPLFLAPERAEAECGEVERLRLQGQKEQLLRRMRDSEFEFVSILHGAAEDFAAEIVAVSSQTLLQSGDARIGFPSIGYGVFPSYTTLIALREKMGLQRLVNPPRSLHSGSLDEYVELNLATQIDWDFTKTPLQNENLGRTLDIPAPADELFETKVLKRCPPTGWLREMVVRQLLPPSARPSEGKIADENFEKEWSEYCLSSVFTSTDADCNALLTRVIRSQEGHNSTLVRQLIRSSWRRSIPVDTPSTFITFKRGEAHEWEQKISALELQCQNPATHDSERIVMFDCSADASEVTAKLVAQLQTRLPRGLRDIRVVLVGDWVHAGNVMPLLDQAAIISPASPLSRDDIGSLQEITAISRDGDENSAKAQNSLAAAIKYAEVNAIPHLVTKGKASERLVAALATEACRICSLQCEPAEVDFAATRLLGMLAGPFQLMDFYGTDRVLNMVESSPSTPATERVPVVARTVLTKMISAGFLGSESPRGGFYHNAGGVRKAAEHLRATEQAPLMSVNQHVYRTFMLQRPTPDEIADRLLFAMVRESSNMLLDGTLASTSDANLLSVGMGFPHSKGGVLTVADSIGLAKARDKMISHADLFGPSFLPNQLIETMASHHKTFASLDKNTLELATKMAAMEEENEN
eukprot:GILI01022524.1.p1 GENE.GILI01022524.1~~GILI01022524.1.p1  ORF type:complete len:895 (+),score=149.31 GILI01022524.1:54-2738(+)